MNDTCHDSCSMVVCSMILFEIFKIDDSLISSFAVLNWLNISELHLFIVECSLRMYFLFLFCRLINHLFDLFIFNNCLQLKYESSCQFQHLRHIVPFSHFYEKKKSFNIKRNDELYFDLIRKETKIENNIQLNDLPLKNLITSVKSILFNRMMSR